jgi:hypothetical protein
MSDTGQLPQRFPVDTELAEMDDPEFLDWCRRVRSAKEMSPRDHVPEELQAEFERVNRAFMARAGISRRDACPLASPVNDDQPPATPDEQIRNTRDQ